MLTPHDKQQYDLYKVLKEKILFTGTTKVNNEYTLQDNKPTGRKSCLDHCYTNVPQKINSYTTHHSTFSDHTLLEVNKAARNIQNEKKYIKIRSLKNYEPQTFKENILNHLLLVETMYEVETNTIANNITEILQQSVNDMAPVVRIQISAKNSKALSPAARQILEERDQAHKQAKIFPSMENTCLYKSLRNTANTVISKEIYLKKKNIFENEKSIKKQWKLAKDETGQTRQTSPTVTRDGNKVYTKPQEIAAVLNRQYISSIRKTIADIPATDTNPLSLYSQYLGPIDHN